MEQILQALLSALTTVAVVAIGVGAKYLCSLLQKLGEKSDAETSKIKDEQVQALVNGTLDKVQSLVEEAIHLSEGTLVKEIKEATEDGKLTLEEGKTVLEETARTVYSNLTPEAIKLLEGSYNDIMGLIQAKVQKTFDELKSTGDI